MQPSRSGHAPGVSLSSLSSHVCSNPRRTMHLSLSLRTSERDDSPCLQHPYVPAFVPDRRVCEGISESARVGRSGGRTDVRTQRRNSRALRNHNSWTLLAMLALVFCPEPRARIGCCRSGSSIPVLPDRYQRACPNPCLLPDVRCMRWIIVRRWGEGKRARLTSMSTDTNTRAPDVRSAAQALRECEGRGCS